MKQFHATPFSTLTDDEFLKHLLNKEGPAAEDIESALRLELLLGNYSALLEDIHTTVLSALDLNPSPDECLERIRELTAPATTAK